MTENMKYVLWRVAAAAIVCLAIIAAALMGGSRGR